MENYKPKEKRENRPDKKIEKVISGTAQIQKKGAARKFTDIFLANSLSEALGIVYTDVVVPSVKRMLLEAVTNGADTMLYGRSGRRSSSTSRISYNRYYDDRYDSRRGYSSSNSVTGYDFDDITFDSRGDAEVVLDAMNDIIDQYGMVSVGDLYDLSEVSTSNYNLQKYGWDDLRGSRVTRLANGRYVLKLPKAKPLNQ